MVKISLKGLTLKKLATKTTLRLFLICLSLSYHVAQAEPWLSTRFAQNCSGCHSPGRRNLPPPDRRCSLSCQGCHINPNGGGMRSHYGKWNQSKWLHSFRVGKTADTQPVGPFHVQNYGKEKYQQLESAELQSVPLNGFPLISKKLEGPELDLYGKDREIFHQINAKNLDHFLYSVPEHDPWRKARTVALDGGADVRTIVFNSALQSIDQDAQIDRTELFLMQASLGFRYRPVHSIHLVYEGEYLGRPNGNINDLKSMNLTRSMYLKVDDLAWNTFTMVGQYKPLFGNYVADHTALTQQMLAMAMSGQNNISKVKYEAMSIGLAPNVPYVNFHFIGSRRDSGIKRKETGFASNLGLRFVTLGASINYSYWKTKDATNAAKNIGIEMHSINGGLSYDRFLLSLEGISLIRDETMVDFREGGVFSLESRYRFFRENYMVLAYAKSNTAADLTPGNASQWKIGLRSFILPGFDISLFGSHDRTESSIARVIGNTLSSVFHIYF